MNEIPLPRRPDKVPWWKKLFGIETELTEELPPVDSQVTIDDDIGLAIDGTIPRSHNFGHPNTDSKS